MIFLQNFIFCLVPHRLVFVTGHLTFHRINRRSFCFRSHDAIKCIHLLPELLCAVHTFGAIQVQSRHKSRANETRNETRFNNLQRTVVFFILWKSYVQSNFPIPVCVFPVKLLYLYGMNLIRVSGHEFPRSSVVNHLTGLRTDFSLSVKLMT